MSSMEHKVNQNKLGPFPFCCVHLGIYVLMSA